MAAAIPHAHSPSQFAEHCLGPKWALAVAVAETCKILLVVGAIVVGLGSYLSEIFGYDSDFSPLVWPAAMVLDSIVLSWGGALSLNVQSVLTILAVALLGVFYIGALTLHPELSTATSGTADPPFSNEVTWSGIFFAWPFCMWFFLGCEELPLAKGIARDPYLLTPALQATFTCLTCIAFLTFVLSSTVDPGAAELSSRPFPLLDGYRAVFGDSDTTRYACLVLTIGLFASLHSFIFAAGEMVSRCAEAGYLPGRLATRQKSGVPVLAIWAAVTASLIAVLILNYAINDGCILASVLISACLVSSIFSYICQLACFFVLRESKSSPERAEDESKMGYFGAVASVLLGLVSMGSVVYVCTERTEYWYGIALVVSVALFWIGFCLLRKENSRQSPDEKGKPLLVHDIVK